MLSYTKVVILKFLKKKHFWPLLGFHSSWKHQETIFSINFFFLMYYMLPLRSRTTSANLIQILQLLTKWQWLNCLNKLLVYKSFFLNFDISYLPVFKVFFTNLEIFQLYKVSFTKISPFKLCVFVYI